MDKNDFLNQLANELEVENIELTEETSFNSLDNYDSMASMSIIAFVDEKFNKQLSAEQLKGITTVRSLMEIIGMENFE